MEFSGPKLCFTSLARLLALFLVFSTITSVCLAVDSLESSVPTSGAEAELTHKRNLFHSRLTEVIPNYLRNFISSRPRSPKLAICDEDDPLLSGINCTSLCREHAGYWFDHIEWEDGFQDRETWAMQMIDAWGKFPAGVLSGHTTAPGDFYECLQIKFDYEDTTTTKPSSFKGSYCASYILPDKEAIAAISRTNPHQSKQSVSVEEFLMLMSDPTGVPLFPFLGTCFPSTCSVQESQILLNNIFKNLTIEFAPELEIDYYFNPTIVQCYTDEKPPFDAGDITMIVVLSIIGGLCVVGTIFDVVIYRRMKGSKGMGQKALVAFSVYTNTQKWLSTNANADNFGCLHGLRFLSMAWVVLCHSFAVLVKFQLSWNLIDMKTMYAGSWTLAAVMNGTVSVDTFFVMGGALVAYNVLKILDKSKGKINIPLMYFHRYCRLTPTYAIITGIMATILPYFGSAPAWYLLELESKNCEKNWWHNILYINNIITYGPTNGICYGESWYLSNDMQFYILSPFLIWPIWKWKKVGLAILAVLSVLSIASPTIVTAVKDLPPTLIPFIPAKSFYNDLYVRPWTRVGPYLVGIFLGFVLHQVAKSKKNNKERRLSMPVVLIAWALSTAIGLAVVFSAYPFYDPANFEDTTTGVFGMLYSGFHRFVWAVMIAWIIFACIHGYGGWINDFLSWTPFIPLGRLTFCVYITSYHLQMLFHLNSPTPVMYNVYTTVNYFFSHMVMSMLIGYVLTITLESPFMQLEKLIFTPERPPRPPQVQNAEPTMESPQTPTIVVEPVNDGDKPEKSEP